MSSSWNHTGFLNQLLNRGYFSLSGFQYYIFGLPCRCWIFLLIKWIRLHYWRPENCFWFTYISPQGTIWNKEQENVHCIERFCVVIVHEVIIFLICENECVSRNMCCVTSGSSCIQSSSQIHFLLLESHMPEFTSQLWLMK